MASRQTHPISTPFGSGQAVRFALLRARSLDRLGRYGGGHPQPIKELGGDVLVIFASVLVPKGTFFLSRCQAPRPLCAGRRDGGLIGAATSPGDRTRFLCP